MNIDKTYLSMNYLNFMEKEIDFINKKASKRKLEKDEKELN